MAYYHSFYLSRPLPGPPPTIASRTNIPDTPFPFLSLPRELRDLVYSYAFHDHGIRYCDRIKATTQWSQRRMLASHLNLLLTSRQIHTEALSALFRTQTLEISPRRLHWTRSHLNPLSLSHVLYSFPLAPARLMTRLQIDYFECSIYFPPTATTFAKASDEDLMFAMWEHIVRDAWTLRAHFPRLNRFKARFRMLGEKMERAFFADQDDYHTLNELKRCQRREQVVARVVSWLDSKLGGRGLVPPRWLKITFSDELEASDSHATLLQFQHEVIEQTHLLLAKKREITHEEREASGRVWLEECSMQRKRRRKGWHEEVDLP